MKSFKLDDYSDRELVHVVVDLANEEGWTSAADVAKRVGLPEENVQSVTVRFSWMKRYGILERSPKVKLLWRLTKDGQDMVKASASTNGRYALISKLSDAEIVWVSHTLAGRFQEAKDPHAVMTRREWQREFRRRGAR